MTENERMIQTINDIIDTTPPANSSTRIRLIAKNPEIANWLKREYPKYDPVDDFKLLMALIRNNLKSVPICHKCKQNEVPVVAHYKFQPTCGLKCPTIGVDWEPRTIDVDIRRLHLVSSTPNKIPKNIIDLQSRILYHIENTKHKSKILMNIVDDNNLTNEINNAFAKCPENHLLYFEELYYMILNGNLDSYKCDNGRMKNFDKRYKKWTTACLNNCPCNIPQRTATTKETWDKKPQSERKHHGKKSLQGMRAIYGDHINSSYDIPGVTERIEATNMKKYGYKYLFSSPEFQKLYPELMEAAQGVTHPAKKPTFAQTIRKTHRRKYGVDHYTQTEEYRERIRQTSLVANGTLNYSQKHIKHYNKYINDDDFIRIYYKKGLIETASYFNIHICTVRERLWSMDIYVDDWGKSVPESEVKQFLTDNSIEFIENQRMLKRRREIDVLVESENLGIEFCGLYWHSTKSSKKAISYHHDKWLECKDEHDLNLLTIFEDEWVHKIHVWKNIILDHLGTLEYDSYDDNDISIRIVSKEDEQNFIDKYHLLEYEDSTVAYGIYNGDELCELFSFNDNKLIHHASNYNFDLTKCWFDVFNIVGSKFPQIEYINDDRFGNMKNFLRIGFKVVDNTEPIGYYTNYRKKSVEIFEGHKDVIYDCGGTRMVLDIN